MMLKELFAAVFVAFATFSLLQAQESDMVYVEGGTFQMGSTDAGDKDAPVHNVTVSSFYMSKVKVSLGLWGDVTGYWPFNYANVWYNKPVPEDEYDSIPAFGISWYEAISFCNRLSVLEGLAPCYAADGSKDAVTYAFELYKTHDAYMTSTTSVIRGEISCDWEADGYRLPTEAEWEYAARGGKHKSSYKFSGSNDYRKVVNREIPYKMAQKQPNVLGLYDMSMGPEWCWDLYSKAYYSESAGSTDPHGPVSGDLMDTYIPGKEETKKEQRVQRGGDYCNAGERSAMVYRRGADIPEKFEVIVGPSEYMFRLVRRAGSK